MEMLIIINCLIGIANSDNLVIFNFRNSKVDLKENYNRKQNSNARRFLNTYALK